MFKKAKLSLQNFRNAQFGSLTGSAAIGQIITYLTLPFLARVYSPDEFSGFSKFLSWVIPLSILASFRIELAIPSQPSKELQYKTAFISLTLLIMASVGIQLLLALGEILGFHLSYMYGLLPIGIISTSAPQILFFLNTSLQRNVQSASYRIFNNIVLQLTSIFLGYTTLGASGLIIGYLVGQWVGILILLKGHFYTLWSWKNKIQWQEISLEYKEYVLFATPQAIIETLQLSGTIFFLTILFGEPYPGIFYLCWRILQAPVNLISNSIFVIEYNKCSQLSARNLPYISRIKKSFRSLTIIAIPMGLIFLFFGPQIFTLVLGEQHAFSGKMASYLSLWFVVQFIVSPFSYTAILAQKQHLSLLFNSFDIIAKLMAFSIGFLFDNIWMGLGTYSVLSAIIGLGIYRWYLQISS